MWKATPIEGISIACVQRHFGATTSMSKLRLNAQEASKLNKVPGGLNDLRGG